MELRACICSWVACDCVVPTGMGLNGNNINGSISQGWGSIQSVVFVYAQGRFEYDGVTQPQPQPPPPPTTSLRTLRVWCLPYLCVVRIFIHNTSSPGRLHIRTHLHNAIAQRVRFRFRFRWTIFALGISFAIRVDRHLKPLLVFLPPNPIHSIHVLSFHMFEWKWMLVRPVKPFHIDRVK